MQDAREISERRYLTGRKQDPSRSTRAKHRSIQRRKQRAWKAERIALAERRA